MPRATFVTILAFLTVAAGTIVAWRAFRANRNLPQPPVLANSADVDPQVVELIDQCIEQVRDEPDDPSHRAKLAMAYHANGLLELAETAYDHALQLEPANPKLWHHIALLRASQGEEQAAIEALQRAIQLDPKHAPLHWRLGFLQLDLDELDAAQAAFTKALKLNSTDVAASAGLARVHLARRDYSKAADQLNSILSRADGNTPNPSYIRQLLSVAERGLGRNAPANSTSERGVETDWPDAWHDEILALRTGYHPTLKMIEADLAAGNVDRALTNIDQLLRRHPNDLGGLNYLAASHFMKNRWLDGIAVLQKALEIDPSHYATHMNLTVGLLNIGEFDQALQHAQKAVEANPTYGDAHVRLARVLIRMGRVEEAVEPLKKAVQYGVNDASTRTMLGQTLLNLKRWSEAQAVFSQTIQLSPEHAPAHIGLAFAKAELGDLQQAKTSLQTGLKLDPQVNNADRIAARIREIEQTNAQGPRMSP